MPVHLTAVYDISIEHIEWNRDFDVNWRIMKGTANIYQKVFLSLSDSFCFVNFWGEFLSPKTQNGIEILTFTGEL